jgi:hypothetical protein
MIKTSTSNLLLLHTYGETTELQKQEIAQLSANDPDITEELMSYVRTKRQHLNKKLLSPSATSVRLIIEHSLKDRATTRDIVAHH